MKHYRELLIFAYVFSVCSVSVWGQNGYVLREEFRSEINDFASSPVIQEGFKYIVDLESETRSDHIRLTEVEAPPFKEDQRAMLFKGMITKYRADSIWTDEVGNVLALWKGQNGERTVALDAHLDTVFPEGTDVSVEEKGDTLYAPGIGDDTRGLAMLLTVAKTLDHLAVDHEDDILLIASVGEEGLGDLRGVKHIFSQKGPKIDSWISIDGGDIGRVNNKGLGSYRYEITCKGPGGH